MGKYAALFIFTVVLVIPCASLAEHTVYYRYTVLGYVKELTGAARSRAAVELVREKTGFAYRSETDESGFYVLVARLGDESVGETLRLRVAARPVTIIARFDPADHVSERGTRVDVIGDTPVETPATFLATLQRLLAR